LTVSPEVSAAVEAGRAVVALESTLIAHGLPRPLNLETARAAEAAARAAGAVPATVAVVRGVPTVGVSADDLTFLATSNDVWKASRRDLAATVIQKRTAATTVSATMALAHAAGLRVFATGGIGGVHRGDPHDVSADLAELARTPVLVVCAGAKSLLDLPATLEHLESLGVPVLGYRTDAFPEFFTVGSGLPVSARVESPAEAAAVFAAHVRMGGAGAVLAQPADAALALPRDEFERALATAEAMAAKDHISGPKLTPFLLGKLTVLTNGKTLVANRALVVANATLAAQVATALASGAA
jgi:pseudouridine-5'-phosphate glycosidase